MPVEYLAEANYTVAIAYDSSNNAEYVGEARVGSSQSAALWRIRKITYDASNNAIKVEWASGNSSFDKKYSDRTSYTYS